MMKIPWNTLNNWTLLSVSTLFVLILAAWGVGLRVNLTESLPRGLYLFVDGPADPGDLVAVCLTEDRARFGFERGYLPPGPCPGQVAPLLKRVAAAEGESVELRDDGVWLDGHRLQLAAPPKDSRGRSLEPLSNGLYRLQAGELWLVTDRVRSWDSRYLGPFHQTQVLGRVLALWTFE